MQSQHPQSTEVWLRPFMSTLQNERIELRQQNQKKPLLLLNRHQHALIEHEPNRYRETRIVLPQHPDIEVVIFWLDTLQTWFRSLPWYLVYWWRWAWWRY